MALELRKKFGKFENLTRLGQGAMGEVYKAHDPLLDRPVALKMVSPSLVRGKDSLKRFQRESPRTIDARRQIR